MKFKKKKTCGEIKRKLVEKSKGNHSTISPKNTQLFVDNEEKESMENHHYLHPEGKKKQNKLNTSCISHFHSDGVK